MHYQHTVNLANMEMSVRFILPNIIRMYDLDFKYDVAWMTLFRSTSMASDSNALQLTTSRATNV